MQPPSDVTPVEFEYLPWPHTTHCSSVSPLNFPASHSVQFPPASTGVKYLPATQPVHESDPAVDVAPCSQGMHSSAPGAGLYFPAVHAMHALCNPVNPALHMHSVRP